VENIFTNRRYPSTSHLQRLFDSSLDVICSIDSNGRFIDVSGASLKVLGYRPEELIGRFCTDLVVEEDIEVTKEVGLQVKQGTGVINFENRYYGKDGRIVPIAWSAQWDPKEDLMFCIARDVSGKKAEEILKAKYEQRILQQHAEMIEILDRITDGFFAVDSEWRFVYGNKQVEKMLSIRVEDYLGKSFWDCFPEMVGTIYDEKYRLALQTKEHVHFDAYFPPFAKWFSVDAYPSHTGLSVFFRDNTERRRVEEELRSSNERFQLAAKSDAIYDWDLATNLIQWGEGLYNLFGYSSEEMQIDQWTSALQADRRDTIIAHLSQAIEDASILFWKDEYQLQKKDGSYCYVFERGHIVRDNTGKATRMVGILQDITDRVIAESEQKRFEQKIAIQDKQLVSVLEQMNQGFFSLDREFKVLYWNRKAEEILGIPRENVLGKEITNYYSQEALQFYAPFFLQAGQEQQAVHSEHVCPQTGKWTDVSIYPSDEGFSVFFKAVHEKKQREEEIERLSLIAKETVNSVMISAPDYSITWVNDAFTRMTGYTSEDVIGKNAVDVLFGVETCQMAIQSIIDKRTKGEIYHAEIIQYRKNGEPYWTEVYGQPMFDVNGNLKQFFAIATDITERKNAEAELKKLSLIAQQTSNVVIISSASGNILWANEAFSRITGYQLDEVVGRSLSSVVDGPETDPYAIKLAQEKFQKCEPFSFEVINYKKDGTTYWADVSCHPVLDEQGKLQHFFSVATEITERKQLQLVLDEEKRQRQQMVTAAAIQAQERERALVSQELHDNVNQVLTTVKLYAELCRDGIGNTRETMEKSIKLLQESINEIRSLSKRLSAPSLGNIKLKDSIKELVDAIVDTNKIMVAVDVEGIEGLEVDQDMHLALYRILQEHFTNILKHAAAELVEVQIDIVNGVLMMQVKDNGKGFDTTQQRKGIGIANMITRAESLHGTLVISSAPDKGCQLTVRFPLEERIS